MTSSARIWLWLVGVALLVLVGVSTWYLSDLKLGPSLPPIMGGSATGTPPTRSVTPDGRITLALGEKGSIGSVSLTVREVLEDSRCPADVECVWAGRVRVRASIESALGTADQLFTIGEPVTTEAESMTLIEVTPGKLSTVPIEEGKYRFTFKVVRQGITYENASVNDIVVTTPTPGAVTGKTFKVAGKARGTWYFEASFPIEVRDSGGAVLTTVVAQAKGEWMTSNFVPFSVDVAVPTSYIGPATIVLHKDNPSGLPEHDASATFPITIEY